MIDDTIIQVLEKNHEEGTPETYLDCIIALLAVDQDVYAEYPVLRSQCSAMLHKHLRHPALTPEIEEHMFDLAAYILQSFDLEVFEKGPYDDEILEFLLAYDTGELSLVIYNHF